MAELLNSIGEPYHEGESKDRFVPLPIALARGIFDETYKAPTKLRDAITNIARGVMPGKAGVIDDESGKLLAFDSVAFREDKKDAAVLPLAKSALDEKTKTIKQSGIVFMTNSEGLFVPVAKAHELQKDINQVEVDHFGLKKIGRLAIEILSRFENGAFWLEEHDDETDESKLSKSRRYK